MEEYFSQEREEGLQQEEEVVVRPEENTMNWHRTLMEDLTTKKRSTILYLKKSKKNKK